MTTLFPGAMQNIRRRQKLQPITVRNFGGGWNTIDDDISLATRYQPAIKNMHRTASGALEVRFGTKWYNDIKDENDSDIVNMHYFNGRIITCSENGQLVSVDDDGTKTVIWNSTIAAALPSAPDGWSGDLEYVQFVPFKDELVLHNGVDKPIYVASDFAVDYVQDLATGSNVNVPIGKYGTVVSNYHCIAGIPGSPTVIYISSAGTSGVFPGDPAPNDSISIDVGARIPDGGAEITGIAGFKTYLFVFFRGQALIIKLGNYDDSGNHVPEYNDTLPHFGMMGYRCVGLHDNDLVFADTDGVNSARRNLFAGLLDSTHLTDLIGTEYQKAMGALTTTQQRQSTFLVVDRLSNHVLVQEPNGETFVQSASERLKYQAWTHYGGWSWRSGCHSFLGRVFFSEGTKIFQLGNKSFGELYYADKQNDRDKDWSNNTSFTVDDLVLDTDEDQSYICRVTHTSAILGTFAADRAINPTYWDVYEGEPIEFEVELPWQDGKTPMNTKHMRFVSLYTKGDAPFTLEAYVDELYKDADDNVIYSPAMSMDFVGNMAAGFGEGVEGEGFGGGRRSGDPRLWRFPVRFKMVKLRITGSTRRPLQVIALHFLYAKGQFKR